MTHGAYAKQFWFSVLIGLVVPAVMVIVELATDSINTTSVAIAGVTRSYRHVRLRRLLRPRRPVSATLMRMPQQQSAERTERSDAAIAGSPAFNSFLVEIPAFGICIYGPGQCRGIRNPHD